MDGGNSMPGAGGMLRLDMLLHPQHPSRRHQILPFSTAQPHHHQQQQMSHPCPSYSYGGRGDKQLPLLPSPEDESGFGKEGVGAGAGAGAAAADGVKHVSPSPWHRMKWTDSMVRLLIMAVYRMGDDGAGTEGDLQPQTAKGKKSSIQQQQQQQKGKWKSVSRAMVEKGFYVSPQQCEDKFNDLNKRYKRVNDLLGKGTACQVVENQSLLDSMDHLSTKAKDEARKLLNSKHLFFREMCAYHNGGAAAAPPPPPPPPLPSDQSQQQPCFHHPLETATSLGSGCGALGRAEEEQGHHDGDDDMNSEYDEADDYDDDDDDDDDNSEGVNEDNDVDNRHRQQQQQSKHEEEDEDEESKGFTTSSSCLGAKRLKGTNMTASLPLSLSLGSPPAISIQNLRNELTELAGRGEEQQRQWLKRKAAELEEQRVGYQCQALQLERQRFKWLRYSSNKEREMERTKLDNDRLRLQNERMLLLLRQKELQLTTPQFPQQQPNNVNKDYPTAVL